MSAQTLPSTPSFAQDSVYGTQTSFSKSLINILASVLAPSPFLPPALFLVAFFLPSAMYSLWKIIHVQVINDLSLELLKNPFTSWSSTALATSAALCSARYCLLPLKCKLLSAGITWQAEPIVRGALVMPYKVKWSSCISAVAGTGWRLEEQGPTVKAFVIYFSVTWDGAVFRVFFRAGFQALPPPPPGTLRLTVTWCNLLWEEYWWCLWGPSVTFVQQWDGKVLPPVYLNVLEKKPE